MHQMLSYLCTSRKLNEIECCNKMKVELYIAVLNKV